MKTETLSGNKSKSKWIVEIIGALLLVFFIHTLIYNYINFQSLKNLLPFYTQHRIGMAWTIVIAETLIALLLFLPQTRLFGFIGVILISIFAGYVVAKYPSLPHQFGGMVNHFSKAQHLLFYSLLIVLSVIGIYLELLQKREPKPGTQQSIVFT